MGTLFRGMEIHTALLSFYNQTTAKKYLSRTLKGLVRYVTQLYSENKSLEVGLRSKHIAKCHGSSYKDDQRKNIEERI